MRVARGGVLLFSAAATALAAQQPPQRPPLFRAGTHLVRVDAYPVDTSGRIVTGLTKDDFAVFEDGKPQTVESADYITQNAWTPDAGRRDPPTKEAGFELAADAADRTYTLLEGLVTLFGAIREERKSIIYVANGLPDGGPISAAAGGADPQPPKSGVARGRLGPMPRGDAIGGPAPNYCTEQRMTLTAIDFRKRFRDLLTRARQANVSFYPISPKGLQGVDFTERGGADLAGYRRGQRQLDSLRSLASETDGMAIVNMNDMRKGLSRIANDLQSYYVLGYYTTNTTWDGGLRSIKVQLTSSKAAIRARRQYRAPRAEENAAMSRAASGSPPEPAKASAPVLVGEPLAYRLVPRQGPERVSSMQFDRTERIRVEWPVLGTLDRREARLLGVDGAPLPVDLPVSEDAGTHVLRVDLALARFARGEYTIELTAGKAARSSTAA